MTSSSNQTVDYKFRQLKDIFLKKAHNKDPQKKSVSDIWQSNPKFKVKT